MDGTGLFNGKVSRSEIKVLFSFKFDWCLPSSKCYVFLFRRRLISSMESLATSHLKAKSAGGHWDGSAGSAIDLYETTMSWSFGGRREMGKLGAPCSVWTNSSELGCSRSEGRRSDRRMRRSSRPSATVEMR